MFLPHVDVGDIDREDLEGRSGVESLFEHHARNRIGIFEDDLVRVGRTDRRDDSLADTRQHGLLTGPADQLLMLARTVTRALAMSLNAVLGHGGHRRRIDHLRVDGHLYGLEDVAAREVDGRSHLEIEQDIGLLGRDQRMNPLVTFPPAR